MCLNNAKKISHWAKNHVWPARILLVLCKVLLAVLAVGTGLLLAGLNIFLPVIVVLGCTILFITGVISYPAKNGKNKYTGNISFYFRQKSCDLLLALSTFLMFVYLGNHQGRLSPFYPKLEAAALPTSPLYKDSLSKKHKSFADFSASMKDEKGNNLKWKERKKLLKEQIREIKKADNLTKDKKDFLILLAVLVAVGLLFLVAALACSLACSGAEGAAAFVAVFGVAGVVLLLIFVIRSIKGKTKKRKKLNEPSL